MRKESAPALGGPAADGGKRDGRDRGGTPFSFAANGEGRPLIDLETKIRREAEIRQSERHEALPPWEEERWPRLPGEKRGDGASGVESAGRWPPLPEAIEVSGEMEMERRRSEPAAALQQAERLRRLEREQAGDAWSEWPF